MSSFIILFTALISAIFVILHIYLHNLNVRTEMKRAEPNQAHIPFPICRDKKLYLILFNNKIALRDFCNRIEVKCFNFNFHFWFASQIVERLSGKPITIMLIG